ncbi:hypothetical protein PG996_009955 [Apiospora saccharicola]|uniref:Nephrocystin 3-like N-terminal domain-containing protein n=1 Tax=Apiospora saccharicola TaxID=335842 RepID=A0ABR1UM79_9PEZI
MRSKPELVGNNRISFILLLEEVRVYLRITASKLLAVDLPCGGDGYFTPASYGSTILIRAVQKISTFPVLYHFCVPRGSDPNLKNDLLACGRGVLASLLFQLLEHVRGVDLDFLSRRQNRLKSVIDGSGRLVLVLEELLMRVPKSTCVYIVIDGVWKLQNDKDQDVLDRLLGIVRDEEMFVKILVTSPFSLDILSPVKIEEAKKRKRAKKAKATVSPESSFLTLHVPQHVDGGHHDFNTSWVEEEMNEVIRECPVSSQASSGLGPGRKSKGKKKASKTKGMNDISSECDTSSSNSDDTDDSGYA